MKKVFRYIENLWVGKDRKPSLKAVFAIAFGINFIMNMTYAVHRWDSGRSLADLALALGIEAGIIAACLGLTTYSNIQHYMIDKDRPKVDNPDLGPDE